MRAATFLGAAILAALMSSGCGRGTPPQTPEPQGRASSSDAAASPSAPAPTRLTLTYDKAQTPKPLVGTAIDVAAEGLPPNKTVDLVGHR